MLMVVMLRIVTVIIMRLITITLIMMMTRETVAVQILTPILVLIMKPNTKRNTHVLNRINYDTLRRGACHAPEEIGLVELSLV